MNEGQDKRLQRAMLSLEGLSVGDAFGEALMFTGAPDQAVQSGTLPNGPWPYTDDTAMALSIVAALDSHGEIRQNDLALEFGRLFDTRRGYGPAMFTLLPALHDGWRHRSLSRRGNRVAG
ncbi:ADP-ribosylglycohydrolase family protein [Candidatus Eisenbacteria bacterium]|uniref:ADP-ribosylglycohydrolase family protein n=1 Tax=Eiseniibacteriota bacterium TaxID=2212470 RepID=A0ABV6YJL8_UNCEI